MKAWGISGGLVGAVALAMSGTATSALISTTFDEGDIEAIFSGNDCTGVFGGQAGTICDVGHPLEQEVSKIIAKFDLNDNGDVSSTTTYPHYPTISGSEFVLSYDWSEDEGRTGTWTYSPDADDPGVYFWVAKGGSSFTLSWMVATSATVAGGSCAGDDQYTVECLQEAMQVTSGAWDIASGLSHVSFYNGPRNGDNGPEGVPEPATLALFGGGLLGLGLALRRRRQS